MKKKLSIILATGFSTIALAGAVAASAVTLTSCSEVTYLSNENLTNMYKGISESGLFTNITKPELTGDETMVKALDNYFNNKKDASAEAKAVVAADTPAQQNSQSDGSNAGSADKPGEGAAGDTTKLSVQEQLINKAAEAAKVPANAIQAVVVTVSEKKTEQPASRAGEVSSEQQSTPSYQAKIAIQFGDADVSNLTKNDGFTLSPNRSEATFTTPIDITFAGSGEDHVAPPTGDSDANLLKINNTQAGELFTSLNNILTTIPVGNAGSPISDGDIQTYLNTTKQSDLVNAVKATQGIDGLNNDGVVTKVTVTVTKLPELPTGAGDDAAYTPGTATVKIEFGPNKVNLSAAVGGNITVVGNDNTSLQQTNVAINITK